MLFFFYLCSQLLRTDILEQAKLLLNQTNNLTKSRIIIKTPKTNKKTSAGGSAHYTQSEGKGLVFLLKDDVLVFCWGIIHTVNVILLSGKNILGVTLQIN